MLQFHKLIGEMRPQRASSSTALSGQIQSPGCYQTVVESLWQGMSQISSGYICSYLASQCGQRKIPDPRLCTSKDTSPGLQTAAAWLSRQCDKDKSPDLY